MINDPSELMLGAKPPDPEPEPEAPIEYRRRIFHSQIRHRPDDTQRQNLIAVNICKFDQGGNHVQVAQNCPHYDRYDEEGPKIRPGWTAQQQ